MTDAKDGMAVASAPGADAKGWPESGHFSVAAAIRLADRAMLAIRFENALRACEHAFDEDRKSASAAHEDASGQQ